MARNRKYEERIRKQTFKEIKKYQRQFDQAPDQEALKKLKIQTAHPLLRFFAILTGSAFIYFGIQAVSQNAHWLGGTLLFMGMILIILGIRGRKRELQSVLDALDAVDGASILIDLLSP